MDGPPGCRSTTPSSPPRKIRSSFPSANIKKMSRQPSDPVSGFWSCDPANEAHRRLPRQFLATPRPPGSGGCKRQQRLPDVRRPVIQTRRNLRPRPRNRRRMIRHKPRRPPLQFHCLQPPHPFALLLRRLPLHLHHDAPVRQRLRQPPDRRHQLWTPARIRETNPALPFTPSSSSSSPVTL